MQKRAAFYCRHSKIPAAPWPPPTHIVTMSVARLAALHFAQNGGRQLRARASQRMTQGDGAAVHVDLFEIEPGLANHRQRLHGERFVQLDHADVVQLQPGHAPALSESPPPARCP